MTTLAEVIDTFIDDRLERLEVALPGRIEKYDAATQKAQVKPLVKVVRRKDSGELLPAEALPVIVAVPVVFPSAGGFSITFPVEVGDPVLLIFSSQSLDEWLFSSGGDTDPKDPRRHDITDAIAIPGLRTFPNALPSASTPHLSLGKEGGARIHVKANEVCLGEENPSELVAIASRVEAAINALTTKFNTHVHNVTAVATPTGPAISPPVPGAPPINPDLPVLPMSPQASGLGSASVKVKP